MPQPNSSRLASTLPSNLFRLTARQFYFSSARILNDSFFRTDPNFLVKLVDGLLVPPLRAELLKMNH